MISLVPKSVLALLLHYANADPSNRRLFYDLKTTILKKYGIHCAYDTQEIVKECWGDKRDEWGDLHGCGPNCRRCGGTGIFDIKWVRLERCRLGRYIFHIPIGQIYSKPESIQFHGRIQHADYGKASREAELWLYIVTLQFKTWWHAVSTSSYATPGLWPMCRLQKIAMWARMKFSWQRCLCGKLFPTWGKGWMMCKKCRQPKSFLDQDNEVPF